MGGFTILMLIFATCVLLCGIYIYTGHKNEVLLWKVYNLNTITKEELKRIGKGTIIASIIIYIIAVLGFIFKI